MIDVLIHSPFSRQVSQGNSVTADRLELILVEAGFDVFVEARDYGGADARCLVALNARRSAGEIDEFGEAHPGRPVMVVITGTDINHPEMDDEGSVTRRAMARADVLVVLHEADLQVLPAALREKALCIFPSVRLPEGSGHRPPVGELFEAIMAGNLRPEKNPQLAVAAARLLVDDSPIRISSYGDVSEAPAELADEIARASEEGMHFHICGKLDHASLMRKMECSHVLLNTSIQEGGANAICEAVTLGLPVIASDIRGNVGMLGRDYLGFFPSGDARALAELLQRCALDPVFYAGLKEQVVARAPLFDFAAESAAWIGLIRSRLTP